MTDDEILTNEQMATKLAAETLKQDVRAFMGTRSGRRMAWYLLSQYGVFQEGFSSNALELARYSGRRSAGLQLMELIDTFAPGQYATMANEALDDFNNQMGNGHA
ncbi:hypothetical protein D9M68_159180 [compost metagenome]